jgi:hypothetical protein
MKEIKQSYTVKSLFSELEMMKSRYAKKCRSFREEIYKTMESSQRLIDILKRDSRLQEEFIKRVARNLTKGGIKREGAINLSTEVVALATGATSRAARQKAWKRGRVLDYLRHHDVSISKTAAKIKALGGIEKILSKCSEEKQSNELNAKKYNSRSSSSNQISRVNNNREISVTVWMRLSDRDEIAELPVGAKVKLSALRVGQKGGDLKITRIKGSKVAGPTDADSDDEWSENI